MRTWLLLRKADEVFTVDRKESAARSIWKSSEQGEEAVD